VPTPCWCATAPAGTRREAGSACLAQPLVLHDRRLRHALILVENAIGQGHPLPSHLETTISELVRVDILSGHASGQIIRVQDYSLAVIRERELLPNMALLAPAQHVGKPIRRHVQRPMRVLGRAATVANFALNRAMNSARNALPAAMSETPASGSSLAKRSCSVRLTRSTRPLAWLEFAQRISMLSSHSARPNWVHTLATFGVCLGDAEHRMLVGIERDGPTVRTQIAVQGAEVGERALR